MKSRIATAALLLLPAVFARTASANQAKKLNLAVVKQDVDEVKKLLGKGYDPSGDAENRPLVAATINCNLGCDPGSAGMEILKLLVDHGANPNLPETEGWTNGYPLTEAAHNGKKEIVEFLLSHGADPNIQDPYFDKEAGPQMPLDVALKNDYGEALKPLIAHGARTSSGMPPGDAVIQAYAAYTCGLEAVRDLKLDFDVSLAKQAADKIRNDPDPNKRPLAYGIDQLLAERSAGEEKAKLDAAAPRIEEAEKAGDEAKTKGRADDALAQYKRALFDCPAGSEPEARIRRKCLLLARTMNPAPGVPQEAKRHLSRFKAYVSSASGPDDLKLAAEELRAAAAAAPWLTETYYNLGLVQQKAGDYAGAMASYKLYKEFGPAKDADAVQDKLDQLEVLQEKAARGR